MSLRLAVASSLVSLSKGGNDCSPSPSKRQCLPATNPDSSTHGGEDGKNGSTRSSRYSIRREKLATAEHAMKTSRTAEEEDALYPLVIVNDEELNDN